jgi:hypothetical protein
MPHASLRLTPHGHLVLEDSADAAELDERTASRLTEAFARGSGYVRALCLQSSGSNIPEMAPPDEADLASLVLTAPMMTGADYLTTDVLRALWTR